MFKMKLKKLNGEDLKQLFIDVIDGTAEKRMFKFNEYKIHIGDTKPVSGTERVKRWYRRNSKKFNKQRREIYNLRKQKGLCTKCYDKVKAIQGILCRKHYLAKRSIELRKHRQP